MSEKKIKVERVQTGVRIEKRMLKVLKAIAQNDKHTAREALKAAAPFLDSAVSKGLIHKNKAARHKSRLNARIKAMPG